MAQQRAEYRSSRRSKQLIKKAFAKLLREKDVSKITVTDIIREAEISRGTFYAHYPDVYGLFEQIENEEMTKLMNLVQEVGLYQICANPQVLIRPVFECISQDIEYYRMLFLSKNAARFLIRIKDFLADQILSSEEIALFHAASTGETAVFITFFTTAVSSVFVDWLRGNIDLSIDQLSDTLSRLVTSALQADKQFAARLGLLTGSEPTT